MTIMAEAYCEFCGTHFVRAGVRTGDEHSTACAVPVVVQRAWSVPPARDAGEPSAVDIQRRE